LRLTLQLDRIIVLLSATAVMATLIMLPAFHAEAREEIPLPPPPAPIPTDVEWAQHGLTPAEQRFSPLKQIDRNSVADLGLAWSYDTKSHRGLEATPLVVDGVLYATSTWSVVFAVDAKTGRELWRHDPEVPPWKARHACCDVVNRGVAYHEGQIYAATLDGRLQALDAKTGALTWSVRTTELAEDYTITGAPRVVKNRVVIGNGGAEYGVRGYFSAYHVATGELDWRFYTVPSSKAGPHEHPELDRAAETWSKDSLWETGLGGTAWDAMAYDPDLDLLYVGTGNASVYDREKRSPGGGDNLYLSSILAIRPETGELVWHYQTTPGDYWDYTATQHMILADIEWRGSPRKVLMQAPKNGFFYVLDRATGELLSAEKFAHASWASHVDLKTGRPVERPEAHWSKKPAFVSPPPPGAHSWHPMSFHPGTGLVYIPVNESLYAYYPDANFRYRRGSWNTGEDYGKMHEEMEDYAASRFLPCGGTRLVAWDPKKGAKEWEVLHDGGLPGGTLATAGEIVFQGHGGGHFSAFDAVNGRVRWTVDVGVDVMAAPITYAIDGEQYVAVLAGAGGSHGGHNTELDHDNAGRLLAFKLGAKTPMPVANLRPHKEVSVPRLNVAPEVIDLGRKAYASNCFTCHGLGTHSSGLFPDLKTATAEVHGQWDAIVRGGLRAGKGMPSFADAISAEEAEAIRAYVLDRAWHTPGVLERALDIAVDNLCVPVSWATD
jgi:quinohemoprotein ethanol dehydrogenase